VLISAVFADLLWRAFVAPNWVSPLLAKVGAWIVALRFVCAPVMAYVLWSRGAQIESVIALLWPFVGPLAAKTVLVVPLASLLQKVAGISAQPGLVQRRFVWAVMLASAKPSALDCEAAIVDALRRMDAGGSQTDARANQLLALLKEVGDRVGRPIVACTDGEALVHPELARELNKALGEMLEEAIATSLKRGATSPTNG
jgi:hypothetical protein